MNSLIFANSLLDDPALSDTKLKNKLATITEHDIKEDVIADLKKPNYYPNDVELPDISDCSSDDEEDTNNATTKFRRKVTKENQYGKLTFIHLFIFCHIMFGRPCFSEISVNQGVGVE